MNPLFFQHPSDGSDQRVCIPSRKTRQYLHHFQIRKDPAENLFVLHLACHDGLVDAFSLERLDELSELAELQPVNGAGHSFNIGGRLLLDRGNNHFDALASRCFQDKKRKASVTGNQSVPT